MVLLSESRKNQCERTIRLRWRLARLLARLPELFARSAKQFHGLDVGTGPLPDKSILRRRAAVDPERSIDLSDHQRPVPDVYPPLIHS